MVSKVLSPVLESEFLQVFLEGCHLSLHVLQACGCHILPKSFVLILQSGAPISPSSSLYINEAPPGSWHWGPYPSLCCALKPLYAGSPPHLLFCIFRALEASRLFCDDLNASHRPADLTAMKGLRTQQSVGRCLILHNSIPHHMVRCIQSALVSSELPKGDHKA